MEFRSVTDLRNQQLFVIMQNVRFLHEYRQIFAYGLNESCFEDSQA